MVIPISIPLPAQAETKRIDAADIVRVHATEANRPVLQVGRLLEVMVANQNGAQLGILLNGEFLPALLPKGYRAGDRLSVQVQAAEDALVLRILGGATPDSQITSVPRELELSEILNALLPEERRINLERAADAIRGFQSPPPQSGLLAAAAKDGKTSQSLPALESFIESLTRHDHLLDASRLATPEETARVLSSLSERSLHGAIKEAQQALEALTRSSGPAPLQRFAESLIERLDALVANPTTLSFSGSETVAPEASGTAQITQNLALSAAISLYAVSTRQDSAVSRLQHALENGGARGNPLLILINVLGSRGIWSPENTDVMTPLASALRDLMTDLTQLHEQKADDNTVRARVTKHAALIREALGPRVKSDTSEQEIHDAKQSLRLAESLLMGQESLNQVNSAMRAVGQPAVLMVPVFIQGKLAPLEVLLYPPPSEVNEDADNRNAKSGYFQRLSLRITLPTLGLIGVELAYNKSHALVSFSSPSEDICQQIEERRELLSARLSQSGFSEITISAKRAEPEHLVPSRFSPEVRSSVVA